MIIPAAFYATGSFISAAAGIAAAAVAAYMEKSLTAVAAVACAAVFITELIVC